MRPAFLALWGLDFALADVVATSSDPHLGAIRLAWWRERLDGLNEGKPAPAEPRLRAVERDLISRGIEGERLSQLEDAWVTLLAPFPWGADAAEGLKLRGRILFGIGAELLGCHSEDAARAGTIWSLADGAEHCSDPASREMLLSEARQILKGAQFKIPPKARPLTVLAALAAVDIAGKGNLARGITALRHRLFGTFPR